MTKTKAEPPEWLAADLVVCEDGPRAGAWYLLKTGQSSWTELRRLARLQGETEHTGRTLGYVPTDQWTHHRQWTQARARVMVWAPDLAAEAARRHADG